MTIPNFLSGVELSFSLAHVTMLPGHAAELLEAFEVGLNLHSRGAGPQNSHF